MAPGIEAIALPGRTPGQTGFDFTKDTGPFVIWGISATRRKYPWPNVTMVFDISPTDAVKSRRKMLAQSADKDLLIVGMRMPFPGFARIERSTDAYVLIRRSGNMTYCHGVADATFSGPLSRNGPLCWTWSARPRTLRAVHLWKGGMTS